MTEGLGAGREDAQRRPGEREGEGIAEVTGVTEVTEVDS